MCENIDISCLCSISEVCAVSEVLCSVSDGHYTESGNSSVSDEEKGRRAHKMHVSFLRRETCSRNTRLLSEEEGDAPLKCASRILGTRVSFLLNMHKKEYLQIILHGVPLVPTRSLPVGTHT
jgi:hypothetical protein